MNIINRRNNSNLTILMFAADTTLSIGLRNIKVHTTPFILILGYLKYRRFNRLKSNSKSSLNQLSYLYQLNLVELLLVEVFALL